MMMMIFFYRALSESDGNGTTDPTTVDVEEEQNDERTRDLQLLSSRFTVFAPNNEAFRSYDEVLGSFLLQQIILTSIYDRELRFDQLGCGTTYTMENGEKTTTQCPIGTDDKFQIGEGNLPQSQNSPRIVRINIEASNGVIQEVNNLILPLFVAPTPAPSEGPSSQPSSGPTDSQAPSEGEIIDEFFEILETIEIIAPVNRVLPP